MGSWEQNGGVLQPFLHEVYKLNLIDSEGFIQKESLRSQFLDFVAKYSLSKFTQDNKAQIWNGFVIALKWNNFVIFETEKAFKINMQKLLKYPGDTDKKKNAKQKTSTAEVEGKAKEDGVLQCFLQEIYNKKIIDSEGLVTKESLKNQFQRFAEKKHLVKFNNQDAQIWNGFVIALKWNDFIISETDKEFKINMRKLVKYSDTDKKEKAKENTSAAEVGGKTKKDGVLQSFLWEIYNKKLIDSEGFVTKESLKNQFQTFVAKNHLVKFNSPDVLVDSLKRNGFIISETEDGFKIKTDKFLDNAAKNKNSADKISTDNAENKEIERGVLEKFLLEIYLEDSFELEGFIEKEFLISQFERFAEKNHLTSSSRNVLVGSLLRNGFITSETKNQFQIREEKFLGAANYAIEKENFKDNLFSSDASHQTTRKLLITTGEIKDAVDPKSPEFPLTFQKGNLQYVKKDFSLTTTSCCVCQKSFSLHSDFDAHLQWHGKEQSYPLVGECENLDKIFTVSYKHCIDSYFIYFTLKSIKNVTVEKIVIIRPDSQKSINSVNNENVPFSLTNEGMMTFYVNCFLFNIGEAQPFVIIYKLTNDLSNIRRIEQHLFLRKDEFPKCSMKLTSTRVPGRGELVLKKKLKANLPSKQVRSLSRMNYREEDIMRENKIMGQYLLEGKLKSTNFEDVLSFLLQIEDHAILLDYLRLSQTNKTIQRTGNEYSVTIKKEEIRGNIRIGEIASPFDDIVISYSKDNNVECDISDDFYADALIEELDYGMKFDSRRKEKKKKFHYGMIQKISGDTIFFALRQNKKLPEKPAYDIQFIPQRINFKYQYNALEKVAENRNIRSLLFPTLNFNKTPANIRLELYNKTIESNPEQLQAVKNIADGPNASAPYIIFGPPGTGKTSTVVESAFQLWKIKPSSRILITAGSNAACDEVAKRLCRIFEDVDSEGMNLLRIYAAAAERRMDNTEEFLVEASNFAHGYHFYPSLESICLYRIVVVTLTVAGKLVQADIPSNYFTHIFIDECAASTEPEALIAIVGLLSSKARLILSGDTKQLGPVLKSQHAEELGLSTSMMERLLKEKCYEVDLNTGEYDRSIQTRLRRNFRSHPHILRLSNDLYYNKELIPCAKKELTHWALNWHKLPSKKFPIIFHAVSGTTKRDEGQTSLRNFDEIDVVMHYVHSIMRKGVNGRKIKEEDIGIISPYKRQCDIIRSKLDRLKWFQIEVGSVETFQGKEKPIIIISTVRSNTTGVGFLDNPKRLNVTLSRAQALMIIIGNPNTLQTVSDWRKVIKYCYEHKAMTGMKFTFDENVQNIEASQLPNVPQASQNMSTLQNYNLNPPKVSKNEHYKNPPLQPERKDVKLTNTISENHNTVRKMGNTTKADKNDRDANEIVKNQVKHITDSFQRLTLNENSCKISIPKEYSTKVTHLNSDPIEVGVDTLTSHKAIPAPSNKSITDAKDNHSLDWRKQWLQHVMDVSLQQAVEDSTASTYCSTNNTKKNSILSESDKRTKEVSNIPSSTGTVKKNVSDITSSKSNSNRYISEIQADMHVPSSSNCPKLPTQVVRPVQYSHYGSPLSSTKTTPVYSTPARSRIISHDSYLLEGRSRFLSSVREVPKEKKSTKSSCTIS